MQTTLWNERFTRGDRCLIEEQPVAITINGSTYAVLLATPADLEDFAFGFAFTEGLIETADDVEAFEAVTLDQGIEARLWLTTSKAEAVAQQRRMLAGPTGCGLCGVESLEKARRDTPAIPTGRMRVSATALMQAMHSLHEQQPMNAATRAAHAAAIWRPWQGIVAVREDVGRHNALDKVAGTCLRADARMDMANSVVLLTSRVSLELVQKTARLSAPILCAVSAPTTLAVETAQKAGITLVGIARHDGFEVFTHPERITDAE